MIHRALLAAVAAALLTLSACGDLADTDPVDASEPSPTVTAPSPTAEPSPDATAGEPAGDEATDEDEDGSGEEQAQRERPAGDCAAYADSGSWCTNGIGDYDCEGGQGNGPNYAPRDVEVIDPGVDPFGLDRDGDGNGCDRPQAPPPPADPPAPDTDPRFGTCGEAIAAGYGPYHRGQDPEYDWYRDADSDGVVCER